VLSHLIRPKTRWISIDSVPEVESQVVQVTPYMFSMTLGSYPAFSWYILFYLSAVVVQQDPDVAEDENGPQFEEFDEDVVTAACFQDPVLKKIYVGLIDETYSFLSSNPETVV
jgi:hypothetical protein